jgi:FixJ family two-component response regulator
MTATDNTIVYLIDDDAAVRDALALLIRSIGLTVKAYEDPAEFLETIKGDEIGCLILDIRMPALTGFAVQEQLTAMGCGLPIILMTGHGDMAQCRRAFRSGAVDFLTKPINETALIESLQTAIHRDVEQRGIKQQVDDARARLNRLTPRERSVFDLICEGLQNKVIADRLHLSQRTVETYRASMFEKLEASSVADLVRLQMIIEN